MAFGPRLATTAQPSDSAVAQAFHTLMQMLQTSHGPLRGDVLDEFKRCVMATPAVLAMVSPDPKEEMRTLFHHVAAGPAHDRHLVEWLIQMGALDKEPKHCRNADVPGTPRSSDRMCNALAVHCAAQRGYRHIVEQIVAAGNFRDLDTRTYRSKESLVHLAVKASDVLLWKWLLVSGADVASVDASGKQIWECTTDRQWRALLRKMAQGHALAQTAYAAQKSPYKTMMSELLQQSRELSHSTRARGRDQAAAGAQATPRPFDVKHHDSAHGTDITVTSQARAAEPTSSNASRPKTTKKRSKKKTRQKSKPPSNGASSDGQSFMTSNLFDGKSHNLHPGDQVESLAIALGKLQIDEFESATERDACAETVIAVFNKLASSASDITQTGILSHSAAVVSTVEAIARTAILLGDYLSHVRRRRVEGTTSHNLESASLRNLHAIVRPAGTKGFHRYLVMTLDAWDALHVLGRTKREHDVASLIKRLLLLVDRRSFAFRSMVSGYAACRRKVGADPAIALTHDTQRQLEWYASDHGINDREQLKRLDRLYGCSHFLHVKIIDRQNPAHKEFRAILDDKLPPGSEAVYTDDGLIVGVTSSQQHAEIIDVVVGAATQTGLELQYEDDDLDQTHVELKGFEFSATGIVRANSGTPHELAP